MSDPRSRPVFTSHDAEDEYDEALSEGEGDYYDDYARNDYQAGTPGWLGYRAGQDSAHKRARQVPRDDVDDTPSIAHCDDYGTGEGRYHGRI